MAADQSNPPGPANQSVGELVRDASEQISALVRAEIELAKVEFGRTVKRGGIGAGLFSSAGVVVLLSLPFLFVAAAEGLVSAGLWRWLSYLIVWGAFMLVAGILALLGRRSVRKMEKPERTMETMRETARWARHPTSRASGDGAH